jgi:hypothetical protein
MTDSRQSNQDRRQAPSRSTLLAWLTMSAGVRPRGLQRPIERAVIVASERAAARFADIPATTSASRHRVPEQSGDRVARSLFVSSFTLMLTPNRWNGVVVMKRSSSSAKIPANIESRQCGSSPTRVAISWPSRLSVPLRPTSRQVPESILERRVGRGVYRTSMKSAAAVRRCRRRLSSHLTRSGVDERCGPAEIGIGS